MKLLIITQKVDKADPILGFFCRWINEFALHCESVTVIGQQVGFSKLAKNVQVMRLEKEQGRGNVSQVFVFWKLIWNARKDYDRVFVHMTPIWIIIGAPVWILLRKPMYLWYEIKRGSWKLSVALLFVKKVFAASAHGLPKLAKKQVITGHGIDTDQFKPDSSKRELGHIVAVGRITAIKHYEVIVKKFAELPEHCRLTIAGGTITDADKVVERDLKELIHRLNIADRTEMGWVSPDTMPLLLQRADVFMHASQGGLDKVVLQAMACGCPVVSVSEAASSVLPKECTATPELLLQHTKNILTLSDEDRQRLCDALRSIIKRDHSLDQCVNHLVAAMK